MKTGHLVVRRVLSHSPSHRSQRVQSHRSQRFQSHRSQRVQIQRSQRVQSQIIQTNLNKFEPNSLHPRDRARQELQEIPR